MSEELKPCACGSDQLKEMNPYGVEGIRCQACHVSLRKQDWNRIMSPAIPEGYALVPIEPTQAMIKASESAYDTDCFGAKSAWPSDIYKAMIAASNKEEV